MPEAPEVILPLPASFQPVKHVRSTLLVSSYAAICESGYEQAYLAALPAKHLPDIQGAVAGMWMPIELAVAHYEACGKLGLSREAQLAMGRAVEERIASTLLGTMVRMAKEVGVTPMTVIPHFQRFWNRAFDGGGLSATKVGPKEVNIEAQKVVLVDVAYYRVALCGLATGVLDLFCKKSYMQERNVRRAPGYASFRIQWV